MHTQLETKMTQSIESHVLAKHKLIQTLTQCLPTLMAHKQHPLTVDPQLNSLLEMQQVKHKIDLSVAKIEAIIKPEGSGGN